MRRRAAAIGRIAIDPTTKSGSGTAVDPASWEEATFRIARAGTAASVVAEDAETTARIVAGEVEVEREESALF